MFFSYSGIFPAGRASALVESIFCCSRMLFDWTPISKVGHMQTVVLNRPAMARGYGVFLLCVFAALGSGCSPIGFERQHLGLVLDEQKDEARAILVYENLHVSGSSESDLTRAKDLTAEIFRDRYTFCLGYPILQVSLANREQRPLTLEEERTLNLLRSHITIPEASLYLNKDGALCGVQKIRVTKLGEFVEFLNGQISQGFVEFTEKALVDKKMRGDRWDVGTLRLVQKAAKSDFQWLRTTEGRLSFSLPGTPEFFRKYRREILPDLLGVKSVRERLPAFSSSNSANRRIALVDLCNSGSLEKSIKVLRAC